MGHIKEPDGVDFIINGRPLTKEEEKGISNFILNFKAKRKSISKKRSKHKKKDCSLIQ